jgi:hypothetical protein
METKPKKDTIVQSIDTIMVLLEILREMDEIDMLGNSVSMKIKVINKIDSLLDNI